MRIQDNDKSFSTLTWLDLEMDADGDGISLLRCKIYCKFKEIRINEKLWFEGSSNVKTSSFREHAESDMHKHAMQFHACPQKPYN